MIVSMSTGSSNVFVCCMMKPRLYLITSSSLKVSRFAFFMVELKTSITVSTLSSSIPSVPIPEACNGHPLITFLIWYANPHLIRRASYTEPISELVKKYLAMPSRSSSRPDAGPRLRNSKSIDCVRLSFT